MAELFLQPPSWSHWFGTDLASNDVFRACLLAAGVELATLAVVATGLHTLALVAAGLFGVSTNRWWRAALPQATHLWSSLPHLLLVTLLVVLMGPGQLQLTVALLAALLSAHVLFTLSLFWEAERQDFVTARLAMGLPHSRILTHDVLAWVHRRLLPYTRARLPEIVMLHLALSFLGFGIRPPGVSLGRMLFDGLPFMFAAWWLWVFPAALAGVVLLCATILASRVIRSRRNLEIPDESPR
jgi:peptide/nickel transport system permease protein